MRSKSKRTLGLQGTGFCVCSLVWALGSPLPSAQGAPQAFDDPLFLSPTDADGLAPDSTLLFAVNGYRTSSQGTKDGRSFEATEQGAGFSSGVLLLARDTPLPFRFGLGVSAQQGATRLDAEGITSNARASTTEVRALGLGSLVASDGVHLGAGFELVRTSVEERRAKPASVSAARPVFGLGLRLEAFSFDFSTSFPLEKETQGPESDEGLASTARLSEPMRLAAKGTWRSSDGQFTPGLLLVHSALERQGGGRNPSEAEKWTFGAFLDVAFPDGLSLRPLVTLRHLAPAGEALPVWAASLQGGALTPWGALACEVGAAYGKDSRGEDEAEVTEGVLRVSWRALL